MFTAMGVRPMTKAMSFSIALCEVVKVTYSIQNQMIGDFNGFGKKYALCRVKINERIEYYRQRVEKATLTGITKQT